MEQKPGMGKVKRVRELEDLFSTFCDEDKAVITPCADSLSQMADVLACGCGCTIYDNGYMVIGAGNSAKVVWIFDFASFAFMHEDHYLRDAYLQDSPDETTKTKKTWRITRFESGEDEDHKMLGFASVREIRRGA